MILSSWALPDGRELREGQLFRVDHSRKVYRVQWVETIRARPFVVCAGPIGSRYCNGGRTFYIGRRKWTTVNGMRRKTVKITFVKEKP